MTGYGWLVEGFDGEEEEGMRGEKSEKWQQEVDERVTLAQCSHIRPGRGWGRGGGGVAVLQGASEAVKRQGRKNKERKK